MLGRNHKNTKTKTRDRICTGYSHKQPLAMQNLNLNLFRLFNFCNHKILKKARDLAET